MKKILFPRTFLIATFTLFALFLKAQNPTYTLELRNDIQVSATVYEFDIYLLRTGTTAFEYASGQFGIVINPLIKNGGSILASLVASSPDPVIVASNQTPATVGFYDPSNVIRISARTPPGAGKGALISNESPGVKICRIRLSNSVEFGQYQPNLTWTTTTVYPTQIYAYVGVTNTVITNHPNHSTSNLTNPVLNTVTSADNYSIDEFDLRTYPNPFRDRITIDYSLLNKSPVILSVFDANGRLIERMVNEIQQAGNYSLPWISGSRPGGIYVVKLQTGMSQKIARITLIR
jgi:hypothetical protein